MFNDVLKWVACAVTLTGAVLTANEMHTYNREFFVLGGLLYLLWAVRIKEANLIVINAALIAIYAVGLFN